MQALKKSSMNNSHAYRVLKNAVLYSMGIKISSNMIIYLLSSLGRDIFLEYFDLYQLNNLTLIRINVAISNIMRGFIQMTKLN
jgi:hypothetical protein